MTMIIVPALITLAITLVRLFGELQHWSETYFSPAAGGGGALVGISWLIPVFGVVFALRLRKQGTGPESAGKAIGLPLLAFALTVAAGVGGGKLLPMQASFLVVAVISLVSVVIAFRGWPALGRVLLGYALAARIPVALVMLFAIFGKWGTHYDVAPKGLEKIDQVAPIVKWFWIGFVPQMTIWIFLTVVGGMIFGSIAAAVAGRGRTA
jgi:hypothetical protein